MNRRKWKKRCKKTGFWLNNNAIKKAIEQQYIDIYKKVFNKEPNICVKRVFSECLKSMKIRRLGEKK